MIKTIFSTLFLAASVVVVGAAGSCNTCATNNPCEVGGDQLYFKHCKKDMYVQCDKEGACFDKPCAPGTVWRQSKQTCVVKGGKKKGGCSKTCAKGNPCVAGGDQFYFEHCHAKMYLQCDAEGGCFEKKCPPGTKWSQDVMACIA